jgi:hypothetical protein
MVIKNAGFSSDCESLDKIAICKTVHAKKLSMKKLWRNGVFDF